MKTERIDPLAGLVFVLIPFFKAIFRYGILFSLGFD